MFEELTAGNKEKKIRLINIGEPQITRESFYQQLLRQIPFPTKTAAFFLSDYFAIEAISYLGSKGIRVPADLGIAGFDDINYAHLTVPKLTTIHQNMERKAELAVTELLSAIQNPIYIGKEVLLDVMLIARDSIYFLCIRLLFLQLLIKPIIILAVLFDIIQCFVCFYIIFFKVVSLSAHAQTAGQECR